MLKACLKLLLTGIILFIVGIIGLATLAVNGYDISDISLPVRYGSSDTTVSEAVDNGEYYYDDENFSILNLKYAETVTKLDINVKAGNFTVLPGDTLGISGTNVKTECLDYKIEDGILYVTYSPEFYLFNFDFDDTDIVITVPPKIYETANFSIKAGMLAVQDFEVNRLYVDFAAGDSYFSNVTASEAAQLKMTAGECVFQDCIFNDPNIKMTAGSMTYSACRIKGSSGINMTAGDLYMELLGKRSDYNISVHRTAGEVYIDGNEFSSGEYAETMAETTVIVPLTQEVMTDHTEVSVQEKAEENVQNKLDIKITAGECNISFSENE